MANIKHRRRRKTVVFLLIVSPVFLGILSVFGVMLLWPRTVEPVNPAEAVKWISDQRLRLKKKGRYNADGSWKGPRVAIIGVDGLDFDEASKFMAEGRMPHLEQITKEGAAGKLQTIHPTLSPRIWTTIATGVLPRNHGIVNFFTLDPATGKYVLMNTSHRKFPALWEMASDFGLKVLVVSFWQTWPAEKVNGIMVSDKANMVFGFRQASMVGRDSVAALAHAERLTYPPEISHEVSPFVKHWKRVQPVELSRFLKVSPTEIPRIEEGNKWDLRNDIKELRSAIAIDSFAMRAGMKLYKENRPDLFMVYLRGLDIVCHRFWKYHEPDKFPGVDKRAVQIAGEVITRYYERVDEMVGKILAEIPRDTYVMILSDHGFKAAPPGEKVSGIHFGVWHSSVFAQGPTIKPGTVIRLALFPAPFPTTGCRVADVTPTVLTWLGLPLAENFQGRPCPKLVKGLPEPPVIPGYPHVPVKPPKRTKNTAQMYSEVKKQLKSLGYIQ